MHTAPIGMIDEAKRQEKSQNPENRKGSRLTSTWNFHPVWPTCATRLPYIFYTNFDPSDQNERRGRKKRKAHIHRDAYPHYFSFLKSSTHNHSRILALYISHLTLSKPCGEKWITRGDRIVFAGKLWCSSLSFWSYVPLDTWWMPFPSQ